MGPFPSLLVAYQNAHVGFRLLGLGAEGFQVQLNSLGLGDWDGLGFGEEGYMEVWRLLSSDRCYTRCNLSVRVILKHKKAK